MISPNISPKNFNYKDIAQDRENETPNLQDFIDNPYSKQEVERDMAEVERLRAKDTNAKNGILSPSEIHEYATQQEIGEMDWFHEDDRIEQLFPDDKGHKTVAFLTSEFDDRKNHIDIICVMDNICSDFTPVPFALDLTYRIDADADNMDALDKKFSWSHHSKSINSRGFCEAKYFEDTFYGDLLPKGKIPVMPRFVVGYNQELAESITESRMSVTGWDSLGRIDQSNKAKFCILHELLQQSEEMMVYLEKHNETPELQELQNSVLALNKYFSGALEAARSRDKIAHCEAHINRDMVAQSILARKIVG